ncbi:MAG: hypothetical protein MZU97_10025 [Bacillus subtilis]|nr:hypothetical protein [Bacillus subtilis]
MAEHVDRLNTLQFIPVIHDLTQISCQTRRIAGHVNDPFGFERRKRGHEIRYQATARRIEDNDVDDFLFVSQLVQKRNRVVFIEADVADAVNLALIAALTEVGLISTPTTSFA